MHRVVVDRSEPVQVRQQACREVGEAAELAHPALRNLQGRKAQTLLQLVPRLRQALAEIFGIGQARDGQRPVLPHERIGNQRGNLLGRPLAKTLQQRPIEDPSLLEGDHRPGIVQRYHGGLRLGRRPSRHAQAVGLHRVAVDDQVHGDRPVEPGQTLHREILEPHPGMEQLRLVARYEEQIRLAREACPVVRRGKVGGRVAGRFFDEFASGLGRQLPERNAVEVVIVGFVQPAILCHRGADRIPRRVDQGAAIFAGRAESAICQRIGLLGHAPASPPPTTTGAGPRGSPERVRLRCNTSR